MGSGCRIVLVGPIEALGVSSISCCSWICWANCRVSGLRSAQTFLPIRPNLSFRGHPLRHGAAVAFPTRRIDFYSWSVSDTIFVIFRSLRQLVSHHRLLHHRGQHLATKGWPVSFLSALSMLVSVTGKLLCIFRASLMEGMAGLVAKETKRNYRDKVGCFRFHGLHYRGPLAFKTTVAGAVGVAITDMIKLNALIVYMITLPTAPAGVSEIFCFLVTLGRQDSLPIKGSLNFLSTLIQLDHGATSWLVLQTAGVIDVGLQVPQEKRSYYGRVGFLRW
ncbi:hypothetical protein R1flu_021199 [Riccia fluitans]|uniref:Uncharacterized protein n=1 Tax=Riccia fluitans TaxID=41844 RepID=A0ABD1ZNQ3_9MARC